MGSPWVVGLLFLDGVLAAVTGFFLALSGWRLRRTAFLTALHGLAVLALLQAALGLRAAAGSLGAGHHAVPVAIAAGSFFIAALCLSGKEKSPQAKGARAVWSILVMWLHVPFSLAFVYLALTIFPQGSPARMLRALFVTVVTVDILSCAVGLLLANRLLPATLPAPSPALTRLMLWVAVLFCYLALLVPSFSVAEEEPFRPLFVPSLGAMAALVLATAFLGSLGVILGMRRGLMW